MRDAYLIRGKKIKYMDNLWTVVDFYYVPNRPVIYVKLRHNSTSVNVDLSTIINLIVEEDETV